MIDSKGNYLPLHEFFIGPSNTSSLVRDLLGNIDVPNNEGNNFPKAARSFYKEQLRYIFKKYYTIPTLNLINLPIWE